MYVKLERLQFICKPIASFPGLPELVFFFVFSPLVLCIVQARPATVSDCFVENISYALDLVQIPASEKNISKFFAGVPPLPQREEEEEREERGEEGEEGEGGRLHPPKAKRSKSEGKALDVSSLRVSAL